MIYLLLQACSHRQAAATHAALFTYLCTSCVPEGLKSVSIKVREGPNEPWAKPSAYHFVCIIKHVNTQQGC